MNPILVSISTQLLEDAIKIIGEAIHVKFSNNHINKFQSLLISKKLEAIENDKNEKNKLDMKNNDKLDNNASA